MLDLSTAQQNQQSPYGGLVARVAPPTLGESFLATKEANDRVNGFAADFQNQDDYLQDRIAAFTAKTGVELPTLKYSDAPGATASDFDAAYSGWLTSVRDKMQDVADDRNDPSLAPPSDQDIALGGIEKARGALARQAALSRAPGDLSSVLGSTAASTYAGATDPYNLISLTALSVAPEGAPLLAGVFRSAAAMGGQQLVEDVARYGYRRQVDPTYGPGDVATDVAGAAVSGGLFGAGERLGGHGIGGALGAAGGGAVGGAVLGGLQGGLPGAVEGTLGGAALPLAGAGFGLSSRALGMSWRALVARAPDLASSLPLEVRDAGAVAEKAGDLQAQNPWSGPGGDAAHADAIGAAENALAQGTSFELPLSVEAEASARRGQVFYPGGAIDVRYGLAEHSDLVTSHDADFNARSDYPPELQPRDRSSAPAQDQVNSIAANLEPDRLGPSPEANAGAPIVGPDGVVESGNGRALAIGQAYDRGDAGAYRAWLEQQGYDTTGYAKPVLVGLRETPFDPAARADFAHAANGSASLRMSATEQALSDARLLDPSIVDLARSSDLAAASNRDFARAFVAKLPQGERGGMLTGDGSLSANGAQRMRAALAARAYGDPAFLARAFDHPDPNIKAIAGAMADAAGPWAQMRDAATRGDIASGHDITGDVLQAVQAFSRARDEGRPAWEMLNQGDMFQSDTTQLASRMFFRDEAMRQPAGRQRIAEALRSYADAAVKNTTGGRLFADDVAPIDVLRQMASRMFPGEDPEPLLARLQRTPESLTAGLDTAAQDVEAASRSREEQVEDGTGDAEVAPRGRQAGTAESGATASSPDLTLRNLRTGEAAQAQSVMSLGDALRQFDVSRDTGADILQRASHLAIGDRLAKIVGDMPVYTVGPAEMRMLAEGRLRVQPGYEPAGFFDPRSGYIVALDDALRDRGEASRLMIHEGLHGAFMETIEKSEAARDLVDSLRVTAAAAHLDRGGDMADHYGLTNAQEFVSEGFSNPEFQRFLASIPADDRMVEAFGLDKAPGYSLWDVFVAAVRKILGLAPDQHTLLDATMRLGQRLDEMGAAPLGAEDEHIASIPREIANAVDGGAAQESIRAAAEGGRTGDDPSSATTAHGASGDGGSDGGPSRTAGAAASASDGVTTLDLRPMLRPMEADAPLTPAEEAARARKFADAKDAIAYRINADRIAQHPNGPLAGYLAILTRDIHEKGGINVEGVQGAYEGRFAAAMEKILEPYASKWAGLKQDVAGVRDVIRENFGVDTRNETAKAASKAWREGVDRFATAEAKRLGKVFTAADDWRNPQWWESSRAQKFGKATLLADIEREIAAGGLRVYDPDTHAEANVLRQRAILDDAADKIVTDASLGGTHGGAFKSDMRVFRFADGAAGAEAYLRLMDKYGPGRGGYVQMMQAHVQKVTRELGMLRVLGPSWAETGQRLLEDAQLAHKKIEARVGPRDAEQRLKDAPADAGKLALGWLESPSKAQAVWEHMSGQASGVGSELMAGLLSGARDFMTTTRMGSGLITAIPADTVNYLMAVRHNGLEMGHALSELMKAFVSDDSHRREEVAGLGIAVHSGIDAAIGVKRFEDQFLGENLMRRMADFVIRGQGLHMWDAALRRSFVLEFLRGFGQRAGSAFEDLDPWFAGFVKRAGLQEHWDDLSRPEHMVDLGAAKYLHPDNVPEIARFKLLSALNDERQFAYLAGGTERVRAIGAQAKAGTLPGELARSIMQFKTFPMTMLATWGMRSAMEAGAGRLSTLATLVTGMTIAGALSIQAKAMLQGKDPQNMRDPWFWGESFLQGGALGIYGDFFKEAFSRSDTSLTETLMGPLAAIPAGLQGLTSGARRMAEDGEHVNFGAKLARIISDNTPGSKLWYARLVAQRLIFDNLQRMLDRDYARSFARQQQRAMKTNKQGFFWAPGQNAPARHLTSERCCNDRSRTLRDCVLD